MATSMDTNTLRHIADNGASRVEQLRTMQMSDFDTNFIESAKYLAASPGQKDNVAAVRAAVEEMLRIDAELGAQASALRQLASAYVAPAVNSGEVVVATNFEAELARMREEMLAASGFDPSTSEHMVRFDRELRAVVDPNGGEEDPDADLVMADDSNEVSVNQACPLTLRPVLELLEPVEDQSGYVYEKQPIMAYIASKGRGGQPVPSPIAGASYFITAAQLKPARRVIRKQKVLKSRPQVKRAESDAVEIE
eukprot:jgi/Tetstr1/437819/TSEL_026459.t1